MSKRSNENSSGTAPAVKRMVNGKEIGDGNNFVHPVEKVFPYHQSGSDLSPFYLSENLADVNFEFDSDDGAILRIPAHKMLLVAASEKFKEMFCMEPKD